MWYVDSVDKGSRHMGHILTPDVSEAGIRARNGRASQKRRRWVAIAWLRCFERASDVKFAIRVGTAEGGGLSKLDAMIFERSCVPLLV